MECLTTVQNTCCGTPLCCTRVEMAQFNVSSDLLWGLTSKYNSSLVKRESGRIQMSHSPYNLTNLHAYKYCGISNGKAAGIAPVDGGVVLTIKSRGDPKAHFTKSPKNADKKTKLAKDFSRDFRRVAKCIKANVGGYYRPDLTKAALARWSKYHRSLVAIKAKKGGAKK